MDIIREQKPKTKKRTIQISAGILVLVLITWGLSSLSPAAPWRVVNIGNGDKVRLMDFVEAIEDAVGKKAIRNYMPMQMGDVPATWANNDLLQRLTGYRPQTDFKDGIARFVEWFRDYHGK